MEARHSYNRSLIRRAILAELEARGREYAAELQALAAARQTAFTPEEEQRLVILRAGYEVARRFGGPVWESMVG
jgi:hypothetical protein